ncbi:MAG: type I-E CRISPR-associated protein Cse1/CasA, partial [Finegoldia magna]
MGQFNLIDEGWIPVIYKNSGENKTLSIREIFQDADKIKSLSTDSPTQDFAVLRILLAILQTVYSRYDYESEIYPEIQLDEKFRQKEDIEDSEELRDYKNNLIITWKKMWENETFTQCLYDYLYNWHDRFFLFDTDYPFFQVKASDIAEDKINKANASSI